jgi:cyclopropane-fatty-acyl-phospholipid synthase
VAHQVLKHGGLFLLHTVGSNVSVTANDPWFDRYIFPNGVLPSIQQIGRAIEGLFVMEDWHNFGPDYEKTLMAWCENFDRRWTGDRTDRFYRMWRYYLLSAAGAFRSRAKQLWQIVLSKGGVPGGYTSVR